MFPAAVRKTDLVSLRWSEEGSLGALPFYKHFDPTGRGSRKSLPKKQEVRPLYYKWVQRQTHI